MAAGSGATRTDVLACCGSTGLVPGPRTPQTPRVAPFLASRAFRPSPHAGLCRGTRPASQQGTRGRPPLPRNPGDPPQSQGRSVREGRRPLGGGPRPPAPTLGPRLLSDPAGHSTSLTLATSLPEPPSAWSAVPAVWPANATCSGAPSLATLPGAGTTMGHTRLLRLPAGRSSCSVTPWSRPSRAPAPAGGACPLGLPAPGRPVPACTPQPPQSPRPRPTYQSEDPGESALGITALEALVSGFVVGGPGPIAKAGLLALGSLREETGSSPPGRQHQVPRRPRPPERPR